MTSIYEIPDRQLLQVVNPVPRVVHPDWLHKRIREKDDKYRQRSLRDMFGQKAHLDELPDAEDNSEPDLEDMVGSGVNGRKNPRPVVRIYENGKQINNVQAAPASKDGDQRRRSRWIFSVFHVLYGHILA